MPIAPYQDDRCTRYDEPKRDMDTYRCFKCDTEFRATAWPNYCPVCAVDDPQWKFEGDKVE